VVLRATLAVDDMERLAHVVAIAFFVRPLGRPPFLPLMRAASAFFLLLAIPPRRPKVAAAWVIFFMRVTLRCRLGFCQSLCENIFTTHKRQLVSSCRLGFAQAVCRENGAHARSGTETHSFHSA